MLKNKQDKFIKNFAVVNKMNSWKKRGQITIFIIIAILIIAAIIIFFAATERGRETIDRITGRADFDVKNYVETCVKENEKITSEINQIMSQGGNKDPEFYYFFNSTRISYLCYTNEYYNTCVNQQPILVKHIEKEIEKSLEPEIEQCFKNLKDTLEDRGFKVIQGKLNFSTSIEEDNIIFNINYPTTIEKTESKRFENFKVAKASQYYHLIIVSTSIINFEARYGDSEPIAYMALYPNTRIEKLKQGDGTTIYKVSDRETEESFNFASRSLVIPIGYGT